MRNKILFLILLISIVPTWLAVSMSYRFLREELIVDRCLSDYHGSVDYSNMSCDLTGNHPYVPYQVRHPRDKQHFLLAVIYLVALLSVYSYLRVGRGRA